MPAGRDSGLTLIELVVAMALFALVAVMGLQALTGSLMMRDRLTEIADDTQATGYAIALLRHDLASAVPMLFHPPGNPPRSALDLAPDGRAIALSIGGQTAPGSQDGDGFHRVEWRFDPVEQTLYRRVWPTLSPVSAAQVSPEAAVFTNVTGLSLRSFWPRRGWVRGSNPGTAVRAADTGRSDEDVALLRIANGYSSALPIAVDIRIDRGPLGTLTLIEAMQ